MTNDRVYNSLEIQKELCVSPAWIVKMKYVLGIPIEVKGKKRLYTENEFNLFKQIRDERVSKMLKGYRI